MRWCFEEFMTEMEMGREENSRCQDYAGGG